MNGSLIACSIHLQVHNASTRQWQSISREMYEELLAMAKEVGNVDVWEGACEQCVQLAATSFTVLYQHRYTAAMTRELGYDVRPSYDASEE